MNPRLSSRASPTGPRALTRPGIWEDKRTADRWDKGSHTAVVVPTHLKALILMFTGLVETQGEIIRRIDQPPGCRLRIAAGITAEGVKMGDSICINGCCLTVIEINGEQLDFEAGEETLSRTNLGDLREGSKVNMERSLAVGDRLGGHYVTGHVDSLGILIDRREDPPWAHLRFRLPVEFASQVASKGSIAIDGVSLTVVDAEEDSFTVALIPHTLEVTTLGEKNLGDTVNLETDVLAKYVQRSLGMKATEDPGSDH